MRTPLLVLHIIAGTLGMLSGFAAMALRKGTRRHALAGDVFVVSMLTLATSGATLAGMKHQMGNFLGGVFTFYLVATAWMTARRSENAWRIGIFDWVGLWMALAVAGINATYGIQASLSPTGMKDGYPLGPYAFMGSVALLAVMGDIRMLVRRGVSATQRLGRHLWRMCFAQFIAAMSIFLARAELFPVLMQKTGVLYLLSFLPLLVMFFWLVRVRYIGGAKRTITSMTPATGFAAD
jgi:hypothetical protein